MKGLHVYVLRHPGWPDTTNGGVTSRFDSLTLTGEGITGPFEPLPDTPELRLVKRPGIGRGGATYLHAVPVVDGEPKTGGMFGGNYVATSDSRFPSDYPIPVHDRFE